MLPHLDLGRILQVIEYHDSLYWHVELLCYVVDCIARLDYIYGLRHRLIILSQFLLLLYI